MKTKKIKFNTGVLTIELLIAFAILIINITGVMLLVNANHGSGTASLVRQGQSVSLDSETNQEALQKAKQQIEQAKSDATDFNSVNPYPNPFEDAADGLIDGYVQDDVYKKKVEVAPGPDDPSTANINESSLTKLVTSIVDWNVFSDRPQQIKLTTLVTNPDAADLGSVCNSILSNPNGWKNPVHYDKLTTDIVDEATGNNSNGLGVTGLVLHDQKLYLAVEDPPNNGHNLWVYNTPNDIVDWPTHNGYEGSIDTNQNNSGDLKAITIAEINNKIYAFVANSNSVSTKGQLQVIDATNPTVPIWNPSIIRYPLPTVSSTKLGNSIFYNDGYVYLGLTGTANAGTEFNIIDVHTNPLSPQRVGGYSTGGHTVNSIFVRDDYAYITTPNNGNQPNEIMTIIDINPTSLNFAKRVGGWKDTTNPPSGPANHGKSLYPVGNSLYLGRTYGTNELNILNISDVTSISRIGSKDIGTGNQTSVYGIGTRDYLTFIFSRAQFQVWDSSNPANIKPWTTSGTNSEFSDSNHNLNDYGGGDVATTGFSCEGDYFYAAITPASSSKNTLSIIAPRP